MHFMTSDQLISTLKKSAIIGGATIGTYLGFEGIESMVNGDLKNFIDLAQTVATAGVPYAMAELYMDTGSDYAWTKYATQIIAAVAGVPEFLKDMGNFLPNGDFKADYFHQLRENATQLTVLPAFIPFLGKFKEILKE